MGAAQAPEPRAGYRSRGRRRPAGSEPAGGPDSEASESSEGDEEEEEEYDEKGEEERPLPRGSKNPFAADVLLSSSSSKNPFAADAAAEKRGTSISGDLLPLQQAQAAADSDLRTRAWDPDQSEGASSPTYKVSAGRPPPTYKGSAGFSSSSSSEDEEEEKGEKKEGSSVAARSGWWLPVCIGLPDALQEVEARVAGSKLPAQQRSVDKLPAPFGGWTGFTAKSARDRAQKAQRKEVEYVLKCIAWESSRPRTSMNVLCSSLDQYELLTQELRARQFVVTNPVRSMYEERTKRLLELEGQVALPEVPAGDLREEWLLRLLYHNPAQAEHRYAQHVGTFKMVVHASLDLEKAKGQEAYLFTDGKHSHHHHYKDASLLLKVQW